MAGFEHGSIHVPEPVDPHLRRWMMFVDGENLTIRAQCLAKRNGLSLQEGRHHMRDVFVWVPELGATDAFLTRIGGVGLQRYAIRSYYYTTVSGDGSKVEGVKAALWDLGFHPEVFKKDRKEAKTKGVDISLAKDLLGHSFSNNLDVVVLVAGDGDYTPLVTEVKRLGKVVYGVFFSEGLNPQLKIAADRFIDSDWDQFFIHQWRQAGRTERGTTK